MDMMTSELNAPRNDSLAPAANPIVGAPTSATSATTDFRVYLREELARRNRRNPRFSLRAFARVLDVEASALSKILNGKRALTYRMFQRFSSRLDLSPEQIAVYAKSMADAPTGARRARRTTPVNLGRLDDSRALVNVSTQVTKIEDALAQLDAFRRDLTSLLAQAQVPSADGEASLSPAAAEHLSYQLRMTLAPLRPKTSAPTSTVIN